MGDATDMEHDTEEESGGDDIHTEEEPEGDTTDRSTRGLITTQGNIRVTYLEHSRLLN